MRNIMIFIVLTATLLQAYPYEDLVPKFNRMKSKAMVRKIARPTLANLDYAAYNANPVLYEPGKFKPKKPAAPVTLASITFEGLVSNAVNSLEETPLTKEERENPMAWRTLNKRLWEITSDAGFQDITGEINGYKWADPSINPTYQEISAAFIHQVEDGEEIWVRIEFSPWVNFLKAVSDENEDGFKEIYAKLSLSSISGDVIRKAAGWIRAEYQTRILARDEIVDWATELASYWYPTKNTDIADQGEYTEWPNPLTEKRVRRTMRGVTVSDPVAVVRGKPFGKPIYNVYVIKGEATENKAQKVSAHAADMKKTLDGSESENFRRNTERFKKELEPYGSYEKWAEKTAPYIIGMERIIDSLPQEQMGFEGKDGWLFFKKSLEYLIAGDIEKQKIDKNPIPHLVDLKRFLDSRGINLLFVVAPTKSEVYYEKLPCDMPKEPKAVINPYSRKILKDIQDAGVEVIDLLPHLLEAKKEDGNSREPVYQVQDTHWGNRGMQVAAKLISDRIRSYSWYGDASIEKIQYTLSDTLFLRQGDLVQRLPESVQVNYPAATLSGTQVRLPDGSLNKSDINGPILLMGDSYTGVFESVDCKSAGIGSTVAAMTGVPVDIVTSWGGGPLVRSKMLRMRRETLGQKRLVIYFMVARDLWNYAQGWEKLKAE